MKIQKNAIKIFILFVFLIAVNVSKAQEIVGWEPEGLSNYGPSPWTATISNPNLIIGDLTRGSGIGTGGSAAQNAWGGNSFNYTNANDAIINNAFITFTIEPDTGYQISLSTFDLNYRRSTTGPAYGLLQYKKGNGQYIDIGNLSFSSSSNSGASILQIDLTEIEDLQTIENGNQITLRIVPFGATNSSGTWYVYSVTSPTGDNLKIGGVVDAINTTACGQQGFDNFGMGTRPEGYIFMGFTDASVYTTTNNYGLSSPSIKFDTSGDKIITAEVKDPYQLSFWIKGQGTDSLSSLMVEGYKNNEWTVIENIIPLPTMGTTKIYNNVYDYNKFRFIYIKSAGNLAFDDVNISCQQISNDTIDMNLSVGVVADTNVHLIWGSIDSMNYDVMYIEKSSDSILYNIVSMKSHYAIDSFDIHVNHYPETLNYWDNILMTTESGNKGYIFNENQDSAFLKKFYYRIKICTGGNCFISNSLSTFSNRHNLNIDSTATNDTIRIYVREGDCPPSVQTPPTGAIPVATPVLHHGKCCYWYETKYNVAAQTIWPCPPNGVYQHPVCCSAEIFAGSQFYPDAPCPSNQIFDWCCQHSCENWQGCGCYPWLCCENDHYEYFVTDIVILPPLTITHSVVNACNNQGGSITITPTNGTPPYTYIWNTTPQQTTQTITNLPSGNYTVTVTDAHDCSATETIIVANTNFSIDAGTDQTICSGSSTNLAVPNNSNYTYSWAPCVPSGMLFPLCNTYQLSVTPSTTTTYTVTVNYLNCTATDNVTVNVLTTPAPPEIVGEITLCSGFSDIVYSVVGPIGGLIYNWSIPTGMGTFSNGLQTATGTSVTVNWNPAAFGTDPLVTASISCVACDPSGALTCCSSPATLTIYSNCLDINDQIIYSNYTFSTDQILYHYNGTNNPPINLCGTIIINANISFVDCIIFMQPYTKIIVNPGFTLDFERCNIQSKCKVMWDGIYAQLPSLTPVPNSQVIVNASHLSGAINGIVSSSGFPINIYASEFHQNLVSIQLKNYYRPTLSLSPPLVYPAYIADNSFSDPAHFPPYENIRAIGIKCKFAEGVTIGDAEALSNNFINLGNGIYSENSRVYIYNNTFENIYKNAGNILYYPYSEGAVFALRTQNSNLFHLVPGQVIIGGAGSKSNSFTNCKTGAYFKNISFTVYNNSFSTMSHYGIYCQDKPAGSTAINNSLTSCATGIQIESAIQANTVVKINNNNLTNCNKAIRVRNLKGSQNLISENQITYNSASTQNREGIRIENCFRPAANYNNLEQTLSGATANTVNLIGIGIYNTNNASLKENDFYGFNCGIKGSGNLSGTNFGCNSFDWCYYGFYFNPSGNTQITNQGTSTLASDNEWHTILQPIFRISGNLINNTPADWWFRGNSNSNNNFYTNIPNTEFIWWNIHQNPLPIASSSWCSQLLYSNDEINEQAVNLNKMMRVDFDTLPQHVVHYDNVYLFRTLYDYQDHGINITNYSFSDTVVNQYNALSNSNMSLFNNFDNIISDSININVDSALLLNYAVAPANDIEEIRKTTNYIYANYWGNCIFDIDSVSYSYLNRYANLDPELYGDAVYTARVMLGIEPDEYSERKLQQPAEDGAVLGEFILYPNPAENSIVITYTGDVQKLKDCTMEIYDIYGSTVRSININNITQDININDLARGMYLYRVIDTGKVLYFSKFIKM